MLKTKKNKSISSQKTPLNDSASFSIDSEQIKYEGPSYSENSMCKKDIVVEIPELFGKSGTLFELYMSKGDDSTSFEFLQATVQAAQIRKPKSTQSFKYPPIEDDGFTRDEAFKRLQKKFDDRRPEIVIKPLLEHVVEILIPLVDPKLRTTSSLLEIASGSGDFLASLSQYFPQVEMQPTEIKPNLLNLIETRVKALTGRPIAAADRGFLGKVPTIEGTLANARASFRRRQSSRTDTSLELSQFNVSPRSPSAFKTFLDFPTLESVVAEDSPQALNAQHVLERITGVKMFSPSVAAAVSSNLSIMEFDVRKRGGHVRKQFMTPIREVVNLITKGGENNTNISFNTPRVVHDDDGNDTHNNASRPTNSNTKVKKWTGEESLNSKILNIIAPPTSLPPRGCHRGPVSLPSSVQQSHVTRLLSSHSPPNFLFPNPAISADDEQLIKLLQDETLKKTQNKLSITNTFIHKKKTISSPPSSNFPALRSPRVSLHSHDLPQNSNKIADVRKKVLNPCEDVVCLSAPPTTIINTQVKEEFSSTSIVHLPFLSSPPMSSRLRQIEQIRDDDNDFLDKTLKDVWNKNKCAFHHISPPRKLPKTSIYVKPDGEIDDLALADPSQLMQPNGSVRPRLNLPKLLDAGTSLANWGMASDRDWACVLCLNSVHQMKESIIRNMLNSSHSLLINGGILLLYDFFFISSVNLAAADDTQGKKVVREYHSALKLYDTDGQKGWGVKDLDNIIAWAEYEGFQLTQNRGGIEAGKRLIVFEKYSSFSI